MLDEQARRVVEKRTQLLLPSPTVAMTVRGRRTVRLRVPMAWAVRPSSSVFEVSWESEDHYSFRTPTGLPFVDELDRAPF